MSLIGSPLSRARLIDIARSEFIQQILATLTTRVGLIVSGVVTSVLIARSLGPEGRGAMAIAGALTAIAVQLGNFGLHASNSWAVARQPKLLPALIANSALLSLLIGGAEAVAILSVGVLLPGVLPLMGVLLAVALAGIPVGLGTLFIQNLLLGLQRVRDYNILELGGRVLGIAATICVIVAGLASPLSLLIVGTLTTLVMTLVTGGRLWRLAEERPTPSLRLVRQYGRFGLKAYFSALVSFLVLRFDLFIVEAVRGLEAVGQYSIAVAVSDLVYTLPVVVGTLLFPRLARMESSVEQVRFTRDVVVRVGAVMLIAGALSALLAQPLIGLLYGSRFEPSVPAFLWLLPGIVALSVHTIVMNYCAATGYPAIALIASILGFVANVVLNIALLPVLGIVGASISSTIAYGIMLVISGTYFARQYREITRAAMS